MTVVVIDIGSNSIKILIAQKTEGGRLTALQTHAIDARISAGINQVPPRLSEAGMRAGLDAIRDLLDRATPLEPDHIALVATSAVRDAVNGSEFCERVFTATGHRIRLLDGSAEAQLIGLGLTTDPALNHLRDFLVFDLGGGSLECLRFENNIVAQMASLQLGCVRLTERFITVPAAPLEQAQSIALARHVRDTLKSARFRCPLGTVDAVFTGGSMTTVRALKGALHGFKMEDTPPIVTTDALESLLDEIAPLNLAERRAIPGMPAARADVFPAALITMLAVADYAGIKRFHHSLHNLRWGLAAEALR